MDILFNCFKLIMKVPSLGSHTKDFICINDSNFILKSVSSFKNLTKMTSSKWEKL